jgi:hypothetical protein
VLWREPGAGVSHPLPIHRRVWINEFFNRSVGDVYVLGGKMPYGLPTTHARLRGHEVVADGRPVHARYVLAPCRLGVLGAVVAVDRRADLAIYRTTGALRLGTRRFPSCSA